MKHTITLLTENKPGVLHRISGVFLRRKINIELLHVEQTSNPHFSHFDITVDMTVQEVKKIVQQLQKIIEVVEIESNQSSK